MKHFAASGLTNRIYYGTSKPLGGGRFRFTGKKEDVTDDVLAAAFEWFLNQMAEKEEFSIRFPNVDFELVMRRKRKNADISASTTHCLKAGACNLNN